MSNDANHIVYKFTICEECNQMIKFILQYFKLSTWNLFEWTWDYILYCYSDRRVADIGVMWTLWALRQHCYSQDV